MQGVFSIRTTSPLDAPGVRNPGREPPVGTDYTNEKHAADRQRRMSSQPVQDIEQALRDMQQLAGGGPSTHSPGAMADPEKNSNPAAGDRDIGNPIVWVLKKLAGFLLLLVFPFLMLIRLSLYLNTELGWNVWLSLLAGMGATTLVLVLYAGLLRKRLMGTWGVSRRMYKMLIALVVLYCGYSLMYLSGVNVKSEEVRNTYLSLHPVLRVATSSLILADGSLVVTDMARTPDAYLRMGLPALENSKHYRQASGYVEAVDIRTRGRPEIVNRLVQFYYWSMGFNTLRHTGTADHLHVSVPR